MSKQSYSVLVVEDIESTNMAICLCMEKYHMFDFKIKSAFSISQARKLLSEQTFDFIVLDLGLPDGTGEELLGYLSSHEITDHTKVIVLTGDIEEKRRKQLFMMGIIDYQLKDNPINFLTNEIIKTIEKFISNSTKNILVVDDSQTFLTYISCVLRNQNYVVNTTLHSKDVYRMMNNKEYNLVIMDVQMPEIDGLELLHIIRADEKLLNIPIISISGESNQNDISRLLKSGANDFVSKPFNAEDLLLKIEVLLKFNQKQIEITELNEQLKDDIVKSAAELKHTEEMMLQQSRLAQMGEMLSCIAHQWQQPLGAVSATSIKLKMKSELGHFDLSKEEEAKNYEAYVKNGLDEIEGFVQYLSKTVDDFRDFYRPNKQSLTVKLDEIIKKSLNIIKSSLQTSNIEIIEEYNSIEDIELYDRELMQVVLNIFKNAQDNFRDNPIKNPYIKITTEGRSISICDNGGGIPEDVLSKIFDPYFSTKEEKDGTGLGLYMSKTIIKEHHNGDIHVHNTEDGVCFTIELGEIEHNNIL